MKFTNLTPGYYLVMDAAAVTGHDAKTSYIIEVVENSTVTPKVAKPTVDKQVWDEDTDDDDHKDGDENWGETADHAINETFKFKLTATLAADDNFAAYETYKIIFNDTMSAGVTFEEIVSVKVNGTAIGESDYSMSNIVKNEAGGSDWTLTIENVKKHVTDLADGAIVEVIYEAHLNEGAVIANDGTNAGYNLNEVYLKYSNNPNVSGEGTTEELGQTPKDTVWVFTYEIDATKVDGAEKDADDNYTTMLKDAKFVLYRTVAKTGEGEGETDTENEYVVLENGKVKSWTTDETQATTLISDAKGKFVIKGLDHGTYYLKETEAPVGYNKLTDPVKVEIDATHKELTETTAETVVKINSADKLTVINNAGATLPETGGMGTTIFYAVGGVMAAAAAILLITKKRLSNNA